MHYASSPGCWGYQGGTWTPPSHCTTATVAAGLVFYATARRQSVVLAFACPEHAAELIAARPLHERDRAEMARRCDRQARRQPDGVEPLAVGRDARELVERGPGAGPPRTPTSPTRPRPRRRCRRGRPTRGRPFDAYASTSSSGAGAAGRGVSRAGSR